MDTSTRKPRSFFEALEAKAVTRVAMSHATQPLPGATMESHQSRSVQGFDIALQQGNVRQTVWLAKHDQGAWLEPHEALEIAAQLQSYANQSILLRAQAALASQPIQPPQPHEGHHARN